MRDRAPPALGLSARFRGRLGDFRLDVAFEAPDRGVTALFGPSGCGKTSVLRAIAGLERFAEGYFALGGDVWQEGAAFRPVHRRPIGYVFQEASLFPHLDVRANLDYGRRRALRGGARESTRFDDVVDLLGLSRLLARAPGALSGGERQRVALGRALLTQPRLLLMDEPLSALDRLAKEEIIPYLERLRDSLGLPTLYVSHDIGEVERLADHVVLMAAGRVAAAGPLGEIQSRPDLPLARMPEAAVTLAAEVVAHDPDYDLTTLAAHGARLIAPGAFGPPGSRRRVRIAAPDVALVRDPPRASSILNCPAARVIEAAPRGRGMMTVVLALGAEGEGARILARITRRSWDHLGLGPGQPVFAQIKGVALVSPSAPGEEG
ncbi:molybdenum ABC transporter ATP-binding protein [Amaricoccus solimangrovi]|uniref:Molybdenum ABC transporter ATP-binding protein n=1 Tax=Amaricoccus solimangrovi TaxID=2589815 RepID=A0A501WXJ1_9RHOB|nr:molybdenum ABC transporter ATP-binding protein [Amaricoccus solimangrovi]TPE51681.1 molybdenum ABC transporter ATP-binding protein [Amaricoccus solimangrovi]